MNEPLNIVMCQVNPVTGDLKGNTEKVITLIQKHRSADLVVFPELALSGYLAEDLFKRREFLDETMSRVRAAAAAVGEASVIVGAPGTYKGRVYNTAYVMKDGRVVTEYRKNRLPNYGVFDEKRYFSTGRDLVFFDLKGRRVYVTICEDIWSGTYVRRLADSVDPNRGDLIVNISASPYWIGKEFDRRRVFDILIQKTRCPLLWVNTVGGQDELVFDGRSRVLDGTGKTGAQAPDFDEASIKVVVTGTVRETDFLPQHNDDVISGIYKALVTGVRDYLYKNGFSRVIVGVSGGIDSALSLVIAADAIGSDALNAYWLPSGYSSDLSREDAEALCANCGVKLETIRIDGIYDSYLKELEPLIGTDPYALEKQNLQARIRGAVLMTLSNRFSSLVLTTGNKSELSMGYCTLYGDTAGGFCVLKDVLKTMVYTLARYRNRIEGRGRIPESILTKAPTAELKPDQLDIDDLPPYELLDKILHLYIEKSVPARQIIAEGFDAETVKRVVRLVNRNEYKRRQAPPGIKITQCAFGRERRFPITNKFSS